MGNATQVNKQKKIEENNNATDQSCPKTTEERKTPKENAAESAKREEKRRAHRRTHATETQSEKRGKG